jgi:hypothetical protein
MICSPITTIIRNQTVTNLRQAEEHFRPLCVPNASLRMQTSHKVGGPTFIPKRGPFPWFGVGASRNLCLGIFEFYVG